MQAFSDNINLLLQKYGVEPEQITPVQQKIDEFADEIAELGSDAEGLPHLSYWCPSVN